MTDTSGHSVVSWLIQDVTDRFCDELDQKINAGELTQEQATEALRFYPDFLEAWEEWCEDDEE